MRSLHVICGLGPPQSKILAALMSDRLKNCVVAQRWKERFVKKYSLWDLRGKLFYEEVLFDKRKLFFQITSRLACLTSYFDEMRR